MDYEAFKHMFKNINRIMAEMGEDVGDETDITEEEFRYIYESLNGFLEEDDERYPDQFKEIKSLAEARDKIYEAKERLIEKHPDAEEDVYVLTDNYEIMMRILCERITYFTRKYIAAKRNM